MLRCACRGEAFSKAYESSELKRSNDEELDVALQRRSTVSKDTMKELSVTRATLTPFWWAIYTMFKVRCLPASLPGRCAVQRPAYMARAPVQPLVPGRAQC